MGSIFGIVDLADENRIKVAFTLPVYSPTGQIAASGYAVQYSTPLKEGLLLLMFRAPKAFNYFNYMDIDYQADPQRISGPVQFVLKLLDSWRLSRDDAVLLLGFDQKDNGFVQAVLAGAADLHGRDARDRIAHLFHIRQTLSSLFRDLDVENEWLREPHTLLDEQEPLKLLLGGSMEDLLLVKEYVDAAAGR